jgi:phosphoribosyl-dephospho-CoA transferase
MTTVKNGTRKWLLIISLPVMIPAMAWIFTEVIYGGIQENKQHNKDQDTVITQLKNLQKADYTELSMGQQAIRSDIAQGGRERQIMDSLQQKDIKSILDKLEKIDEKIGF